MLILINYLLIYMYSSKLYCYFVCFSTNLATARTKQIMVTLCPFTIQYVYCLVSENMCIHIYIYIYIPTPRRVVRNSIGDSGLKFQHF